ncbi:MAG: HU family DNA-binding protein [Aliishimia sp.]
MISDTSDTDAPQDTSHDIDPVVVESIEPTVTAPVLRKKELLDAVAEKSGQKRKDVKPVVEAMLAVMGEAIAQDQELNLPPFGKLKIQRVKETGNGRITIAKLRQPKAPT